MDKVQVPFILIQNVRNHLLLAVIHQIIPLAAFQQEGLQPVVGRLPAARPVGEPGHRILLRPDLIDKVLLVAHVHQQIQVPQIFVLFRGQVFQLHVGATQLQLLGHLFHRREADRLHHLAGVARAGVVHQTRETFFPAQPVLRAQRTRGGVAAGADAAVVFHLKRFIQPGHHEEDHEAERQAHDHRGVLQRRDTVGHQHAERQQADGDGPEDAQPVRRVAVNVLELRGEVPQHQRAGVRRGDVEQQAGNGRYGRAKGKRRILRQQAVEAALRVRHRFLGKSRIAVDDLVQRAVAENRQPQQGKGERDDQRAHHELTDGAPTRNAREEQADKRRPRHPPRPEEERPVVHPLCRTVKGEAVQRHAHKAVHVITHVQH